MKRDEIKRQVKDTAMFKHTGWEDAFSSVIQHEV
jgi:hypothetical protein